MDYCSRKLHLAAGRALKQRLRLRGFKDFVDANFSLRSEGAQTEARL